MELVKNIFFNTDKLTSNTKVKISYTGKFFQDDSEEVKIHYGFGNNWENLSELSMRKTDLGFQIEIELLDSDTFRFCLKNEKDEWDNNNGENYIFDIEKASNEDESLALIVAEDSGMQVHKGLRKSYIWSKKVKLAVYKIIKFFPKIISGNYKRRVSE